MAEEIEIEVEGKKRGPRSNQKLKIMYLMKIRKRIISGYKKSPATIHGY